MTLKSFYSHNHRLPSPWIRAVTPAPACLPPPLPNSQQAGRRGGCPVTAREGRGREGWGGGERFDATTLTLRRERFRKTNWQTDRKGKECIHQPPKRCRPLSTQLRYAHFQIHTHFPNSDPSLKESDTPRLTNIQETDTDYSKILSTHN